MGSFAAEAAFVVDEPGDLAAGDLNGDGKPDLVAIRGLSNVVSVVLAK